MDLRVLIVVGGIALMARGALRIAREQRSWSRGRLVHEILGIGIVGSIVLGAGLRQRWAFALTLVLAIVSMVHRRRVQRG